MKNLILPLLFVLNCCSAAENNVSSETPSNGKQGFERSPFVALIEIQSSGTRLSLIGVHLKPERAIEEANLLDDAYEIVVNHTGIAESIILGDTNLSCTYASSQEIDSLDLRKDPKFMWLIPDDADTNVAESRCAYDRIISVGSKLARYRDASVDTRTVLRSDHQPVWVKIEGVRIGAFNTKQFGPKKSLDTVAVGEIARIACDGDIVLLQEIVSKETLPMERLLTGIRSECGSNMELRYSDRTGTTSYKERFGYVYNKSKIELLDSFLLQEIQTSIQANSTGSCGIAPYRTPGGYCYATKNGKKTRVTMSCCN